MERGKTILSETNSYILHFTRTSLSFTLSLLTVPFSMTCLSTTWFHSIVINCVIFLRRKFDYLIIYSETVLITLYAISRFLARPRTHVIQDEKNLRKKECSLGLKGCVRYIFANLFCISKGEHFRNKEKCFLFHLESSSRSWDNQLLTF